jgi:tripartite-type tricarboxylate transporter receptor subunit TctC
MNKIVLLSLFAVACGAASTLTQVWAQSVSESDHSRRVAQAKSTCLPYQGRKLSMVIPVKPGGGFDLMGRALEPFLASRSGMSVAVSNVAGGSGLLAIKPKNCSCLSKNSRKPSTDVAWRFLAHSPYG